MYYLVCIKQVPDTTTRFQIAQDGRGVDVSHVKWIISPYDEFAIEEALQLKQKDEQRGEASQVEVLSLGPERVKESLRTALAMGADRALHIKTDKSLDSLSVAQAVYEVLKEKKVDMILCGKQSIDWGLSAVGPMLAGLLDWPSVSPVIKVVKTGDDFEIHRQGDPVEILQIKKPFVLCVTKGINQPRFVSLPGIMKAKKKPLNEVSLPENIQSFISIESVKFPPKRQPVQMIEGTAGEQAKKLLQMLREKEQFEK